MADKTGKPVFGDLPALPQEFVGPQSGRALRGRPTPAAEEAPSEAAAPARPSRAAAAAATVAPGRSHNRPVRKRKTRTRADGRELLQSYHHAEGIQQLRELAAELTNDEERVYVTDLVTEAINDLLAKYGRPPVA